VLRLFNGEKTAVFWVGLLVLALASVILFSVLWSSQGYSSLQFNSLRLFIMNSLPLIAGSIVFILIGLYMMKSGVKKEKSKTSAN
jgi:putative Mn2+ efflux pump MntP